MERLIAICLLLGSLLVTSCEKPVTDISLNKDNIVLDIGGKYTLTAILKPDDATDKTIIWDSSRPEVAKVVDGVVEALSEGECVISAKINNLSAHCSVTVSSDASSSLEGITVNPW